MVANGTISAISTNATEAAEQLDAMEVHFTDLSVAPAERNYVAFSSALDPGPLEVFVRQPQLQFQWPFADVAFLPQISD